MLRLSRLQICFLLPPALVSAVLLFVGGPGPDALRSVRYGWMAGHLLCFALWSCLYLIWRGKLSFWRQLTEVVLLCVLVGGATEILQSLVGREPSWRDVANDVLGGLLAVLFFSSEKHQLPIWRLRLLRCPVVLLVVWSLLPLSRAVIDDLLAWRQFPLLSGFETPFEDTRWGGKSRRRVDDRIAYAGEKSLRVELVAGRYPGVFLNHFPADWRDYESLSLQIYNPDSEPLELHLRIHDQLHRTFDYLHRDRFNTPVDLMPGWNEVQARLAEVASAPRERDFDLGRVAGVGLFAVSLEQPRVIYLDEIRLLPASTAALAD
ncbi:MAG: VanZ family protein [Pelovirga sp.]